MSATFPAIHFELAVARSHFIDAHNAADQAVRERLVQLKSAPDPLLGQNILALTKVPAGPQYSKQEKARVDALLSELKLIQSVRCDVVHSQMHVMMIDHVAHGFFPNVQKQTGLGRSGLLLTLSELRELTERLSAIAASLAAPMKQLTGPSA